MNLLRELNRIGALRTLDDALANTLRRLDPSTPDDVLAAAALASLAVAQGHAAFDPAQPRALVDAAPGSAPGQALPWPDRDAWLQALAASRFVATPVSPDEAATAAPLVLEHGLLYLRRYREYERRLALQLRRIAAGTLPETDVASLAPLFTELFPSPLEGEGGAQRRERGSQNNDAQARAAALALRRALLLVTGGPGTGKTTTIARLLVLRIAQARAAGLDTPRIALAAPTGRAADRMADSLRRATAQMETLGVDATLLAALPHTASTVHRLLGTVPDTPDFRHHADNPLPCDIVVIDEASMVDLPLMCKLTEAVPHGAQLVLLGDADQLPSVEAGDVLAAILAAAGPGDALRSEDAEALRPLLGDSALDRHSRESGDPGTVHALTATATSMDSRVRGSDGGLFALDRHPREDDTTALDRHPRESGDPGTVQAAAATATSMDSRVRGSDGGLFALDRHPREDGTTALDRHPRESDAPALDRHPRESGDPGTLSSPAHTAQAPDPRVRGSDTALHGHRVHLVRNWRQSETLQLAPLADAVRAGDADTALALLRSGTLSNVHFHEGMHDPLQAQPQLLDHWRALATHTHPADALAQANRLRLLTAVREGPQGARNLNERIAARLSGRRIGTPPAWFPGRLLLVTQNSYRHHLFNGDVGLCLPDATGTPLAWFPGATPDAPRAFHPAALPAHESAFATTVHKAQGSEFDTAWLLLPTRDNRVLSRELLYTALTRARSELHIAANATVLRDALQRHVARWSGLGWRLGPAD